jgi:tetratricopeptide (TPR) repeat protein
LILLLPLSRRVDALLLPLLVVIRFHWGEAVVRERMTIAQIRAGDVRVALRVRREGVERAVERGGVELALATATYGVLLLGAGWLAEGIEYLRVAAWMTSGWPAGRLRDTVLYSLASGHVSRGEEPEIVAAVAAQSRAGAIWKGRLLSLRAAAQLVAGDAPAAGVTYRAALAAAHVAGDRELETAVNNNLAGALIEVGDFDGAEARIADADALLSASSPIRASLLGTKAELALARGDLVGARESLDQSEALKTRTGAEGGIGSTLAMRARLEAAAGNQLEAKRLLEQARGRLQDVGALNAWRAAAAAIGEPDSSTGLAPPAPDPLRDRAFALVRVLPYWVAELQRGIPIALSVGIGLALVWLFLRFHELIPGGWTTVGAFYVVLILLVLSSFTLRRFPRLGRTTASNPSSP